MYYIIDNEVYAPYEGHDFDGRATDTIEDGVWELYSQDESSYKIEDGKFIALKQQAELEAAALRARRETECFSVVDRGRFWYGKLTEEQKNFRHGTKRGSTRRQRASRRKSPNGSERNLGFVLSKFTIIKMSRAGQTMNRR